MQMRPSASLLPLLPPPPQVRPEAITKKQEEEEGRSPPSKKKTGAPPPLSFSLKGTDQMATELLNVQQPLASPDGSLLHSAEPIYIPTNSFTSTRNPQLYREISYLRSGGSSQLDGGFSYLS